MKARQTLGVCDRDKCGRIERATHRREGARAEVGAKDEVLLAKGRDISFVLRQQACANAARIAWKMIEGSIIGASVRCSRTLVGGSAAAPLLRGGLICSRYLNTRAMPVPACGTWGDSSGGGCAPTLASSGAGDGAELSREVASFTWPRSKEKSQAALGIVADEPPGAPAPQGAGRTARTSIRLAGSNFLPPGRTAPSSTGDTPRGALDAPDVAHGARIGAWLAGGPTAIGAACTTARGCCSAPLEREELPPASSAPVSPQSRSTAAAKAGPSASRMSEITSWVILLTVWFQCGAKPRSSAGRKSGAEVRTSHSSTARAPWLEKRESARSATRELSEAMQEARRGATSSAVRAWRSCRPRAGRFRFVGWAQVRCGAQARTMA